MLDEKTPLHRSPFEMYLYRSIFIFILSAFSLSAETALNSIPQVDKRLVDLQDQVVSTVSKVKDSVVAIVMKDKGGNIVGSGSGVIVSEQGLIFTAAHVVDGFEEVIAITSDEKEHKVVVLGMNRYKDAAVCRMKDSSKSYPYAPIGDSDNLNVADWVLAMGHGRGYDKTRTPPVRFGQMRAHNPGRFLTTSCPLIGGDSGGPLFDLEGNVVGINSSINGLANFNVHAGVSGFKDDLTKMRSGESWGILQPNVLFTPETPVMGIGWRSGINSYRRFKTSLPQIAQVSANSPAAAAGLRSGDILKKIGQEEVNTILDVFIATGRQKVGDTAEIIFQRGNELLSTKLTFKARFDLNRNPRDLTVPPIGSDQDSPYVKSSDKPKLAQKINDLFSWAQPLENSIKDTFIQIYNNDDISAPLLNGTIIDDETVLVPLSSYQALPDNLIAWRPGLDAHPVALLGGYPEHDLAVLSVKGLKAPKKLLETQKEVKVGEFIAAISTVNNEGKLSKLGVVSVEKRFLKGLLGVRIADTPKDEGAFIETVNHGSAAFNMGIRPGCVVTKFNGVEVKNSIGLVSEIEKLRVGDEIKVEFIRNGETVSSESNLGGKGDQGGRIKMMDKLGRNRLSKNTDSFQTVIQSDILVEPEECGTPIFALDGGFVGIAISDAGRNKTYILPASSISEALEKEASPITKEPRQSPVASFQERRQIQRPRSNNYRSPKDQRELMERLFNESLRNPSSDPLRMMEEMNQLQERLFRNLRGR